MKKPYEVPEFELVEFTLKNILSESPMESKIGENIDPGDPDDPINLDDL